MKKISGDMVCGRFEVPYRIYGEGDKVIVCLSGAKQTMSAWRSFVKHFYSDYRVVVFDMPGQGRSKILSGPLGVPLAEQVEVLHGIVEKTDVMASDVRCLIGGSWGSIVAAAYADRYPNVFDKIVLGSFGTKANTVLAAVIDQVQEYIDSGKGREIAPLMIEKFGQYIPETLKRQIVAQFDTMTEQQFRSFYEHSVFVTQMGDLKQHINLSNIKVPVLVLMGQYDTIMDLFDTRKATKLLVQGEFEIVKGVGHFLHWEQSEVLTIYDEFFSSDTSASLKSIAN